MSNSTTARQHHGKKCGYTVVFEPLPEDGFSVVVPIVPEIATFGATRDEARFMAQDAIRCFLESAVETGEPIPDDPSRVTAERIVVTL